jgi:cytochrome P450
VLKLLTLADAICHQTVSMIQTFFLAMSLHPEVLAKAQEELDTVVGRNRLPALEDRPNLPYIEAILTELARYELVTRSPLITHDVQVWSTTPHWRSS